MDVKSVVSILRDGLGVYNCGGNVLVGKYAAVVEVCRVKEGSRVQGQPHHIYGHVMITWHVDDTV